MYKVMIIDDEPYFRKYLRALIDWKRYEFEICDEASSSDEGLAKIPESMPDIILADINMPGINGIEFSRQVKSKYPFINIILITGYNEFEYAKQAVKIGISNYISKPFEKQELIDSMVAIKNNIMDKKKKDIYVNNIQKKYNESIPAVKNNILYNSVKGVYSGNYEKLAADLEAIKLRLPELPFIISVLQLELPEEYDLIKREDLNKKVISIIKDSVYSKYLYFEDKDGRTVLITALNEAKKYRLFINICKLIISNVNSKLKLKLTIGIGNICKEISDIPLSFDKAKIALKNKFLLGNNKVIEFNSLKFEDSVREIFPFKLKNDLLMYTRLLDGKKVQETFDTIYKFINSSELSIDYIYILYTELLSLCISFLNEYGYSIEKVFGYSFHPFEEIIIKQTMGEVHEYVHGIYKTMISFLNSNKKIHSSKIIGKAKEYIDNNYQRNDLLVEDIAASVFFHPSYLRFLFKKETGITIGEYLTQVRMQKARTLLKEGRLRCTEIAAMLGYSDAAYFSKCFKKYNKISPSEYEKIINK